MNRRLTPKSRPTRRKRRAAHLERYVPSVSSRLALIVSTVLACGCVPIPHTEEVTPKIEGVLSSEVGPVSGAEVRLTQILSDVVCAKAEHITYTDAAGKFEFQPISTFHFVYPLYGDPLYRWNVCMTTKGLTYAGTVGATLGSLPPALIKLDCIVKASTTPVTPQTTGREVDNLQICKSTRGT